MEGDCGCKSLYEDKAALLNVFSRLDSKSLVSVQLSSKLFRDVASHESVWEYVFALSGMHLRQNEYHNYGYLMLQAGLSRGFRILCQCPGCPGSSSDSQVVYRIPSAGAPRALLDDWKIEPIRCGVERTRWDGVWSYIPGLAIPTRHYCDWSPFGAIISGRD